MGVEVVVCAKCDGIRDVGDHLGCLTCRICGEKWFACMCGDDIWRPQFGEMLNEGTLFLPETIAEGEQVAKQKIKISLDRDDHPGTDQCVSHGQSGFVGPDRKFYKWGSGSVEVKVSQMPLALVGGGATPDKSTSSPSTHTPQSSKWGQYGGGGYGGSYGYSKKMCTHAWQPVRIGNNTIYVTAGRDVAKASQWPDLGIYLDSTWEQSILEPVKEEPPVPFIKVGGGLMFNIDDIKEQANKVPAPPRTFKYPAVVVSWPDMKIINFDVVERLVNLAVEAMDDGKEVETGCIGAHGRTGTFLAFMLMMVEKLHPKKAITEVRDRLCKECIESESQIRAIFEYAKVEVTDKEVKELK